MESHTPRDYYGHFVLPESAYDTTLPSGLPSFDGPTGILPQYSHAGRMEAEFTHDPAEGYVDGSDDRPVVALGHTTKILGYEPHEGTHNTPIVVRLLFRRDYIRQKTWVRLRVKMGNIPIDTTIKRVQSTNGVGEEWRLIILAPDPRELDVVGLAVPLIVQSLDVRNTAIIDDVCIGTFRFWDSKPTEESNITELCYFGPSSQGSETDDHSTSRPPYSRRVSFGSNQTEEESFSTLNRERTSICALGLINMSESTLGGPAYKRSKLTIEVPSNDIVDPEVSNDDDDTEPPSTAKSFLGKKPGDGTYQVSLRFRGDMKFMTDNWTFEEINNQRRIVEFSCIRTRGQIEVKFAPIPVEKARDTDKNIVSCIWWKDMGEFVITSVDTINLLERLVGTKFTTEEKNRIRRNLQGFKPATISKSQPESESFFRTLMEFPPPRPRNIEKDVKAFVWSKLPAMLEKVISKYWFVSSPTPSSSEADESFPKIRVLRDIDSVPTESPGASVESLPTPQAPTTSTVPSSEMEVEPTRAGVLDSSSYMSVPSSSQTQYEKYRSGLSAHERLEYPHVLEASTNSAYGPQDTTMGIREVSMQDAYFVSTDNAQVLSGYDDMETYPEAMGALNIGGMHLHPSEDMRNNMQYMTHTSHKYA